jgi:1,4-dihydroxy-6-naphthoate synthase
LLGKLDISKISYGVFPLVLDNYIVLNSGGALGKGVGPMVISRNEISNKELNIKKEVVAIPGENTTAHLLFSLAYPDAIHKKFMVFSSIEKAVLNNEVDFGVIIHENRFTYQAKGLKKVIDLGEYWEHRTGLPIPLGGIIAKRTVDKKILKKTDRLIRLSIEYAFKTYPHLSEYVKKNAQEMSEEVMRQHIQLYVNDYSLDIGTAGKKAVEVLYNTYLRLHPMEKQIRYIQESFLP